MHELKIDKYKGSFLLKFAVLCFAVFILVSLVGQQFQIMEKRQELEDLQQQLSTQNARNEEIQNSLENSGGMDEYAERKARSELEYAKPGERVFIDVGGGA
ncbi:MAG: FtsB family cell division protein [Acutalibacter sp.]